MSTQAVLDAILGQAGVVILLLVILWSGWRGYWVFGRYYEEQSKRIERLEQRLDRAVGTGERLAGTAERATRLVEVGRSEAEGA